MAKKRHFFAADANLESIMFYAILATLLIDWVMTILAMKRINV